MITDLRTHPRRYVTVPELAAYLVMPRATIYWHIRAGKLPHRRVLDTRLVRVAVADAITWADDYAHSTLTTAPTASNSVEQHSTPACPS